MSNTDPVTEARPTLAAIRVRLERLASGRRGAAPSSCRSRRVRGSGPRLAPQDRSRPRRVPLRLRPALRPRRAAAVVAALPDAGHAARRRRVLDARGRLAEPVMALLYAGSIVCWAAAARYFGPRAALAVAGGAAPVPGYALMFHELSSEPVFAAAFAGWALLVVARGIRAVCRPLRARRAGRRRARARAARERGAARVRARAARPRRRPGACGSSGRRHSSLAALLPLAAWSVHNGVRFDYVGARPRRQRDRPLLPRVHHRPHRLARERPGVAAPRRGDAAHLLTREPYRSYGVTLDELFARAASASTRTSTCSPTRSSAGTPTTRVLRGRRASRAYAPIPGAYASGVARHDLGRAREGAVPGRLAARRARRGARRPPWSSREAPAGAERGRADPGRARSSGSRGRTTASARSGRRRPNGTSSSRDPGERPRFEQIAPRGRRALRCTSRPRRATRRLALRLNQLSRWFPRPWMWILARARRDRVRRPRGGRSSSRSRSQRLRVVLLNAARTLRRPPLRAPGGARVRPASASPGSSATALEEPRRDGRRRQRRPRRPAPPGEPSPEDGAAAIRGDRSESMVATPPPAEPADVACLVSRCTPSAAGRAIRSDAERVDGSRAGRRGRHRRAFPS